MTSTALREPVCPISSKDTVLRSGLWAAFSHMYQSRHGLHSSPEGGLCGRQERVGANRPEHRRPGGSVSWGHPWLVSILPGCTSSNLEQVG